MTSIPIPENSFPNPYNHNIVWNPIIGFVDMDIVGHIILNNDNSFFKIMLFNMLSGDMGYYRGENKNFSAFKTSWQRLDNSLKRCLEWILKEEFLAWFQKTPYYTYFGSKIEFAYSDNLPEGQGAKFAFDFEAIAQHYGFATNYLDITTKRDIAEFFACTYWDIKEEKYKPVEDFNKYCPHIFTSFGSNILLNPSNPDIRIVGFQPLLRPICQFAMAINFDNPSVDYNNEFHRIDLPQEKSKTFEVYDKFKGGEELFPSDYATQSAKMIRDKTEKYRNINDKIFIKYCKTFNQNPKDIAKRLNNKGYYISNIELQMTDELLQNMQKHIDETLMPWLNKYVTYSPTIKQ